MFFLLFLVLAVSVSLESRSYDRNVAKFNSQGQLEQLDFAQKAVEKKGGSVIGLKCADALIIAASRRRPSSVLELDAPQKVFLFDAGRILVAPSGLLFEFHPLRKEIERFCFQHTTMHSSAVPVYQLCHQLASALQSSTMDGSVRPPGVNMLIAGYDDEADELKLYSLLLDGSFQDWKATAIGYNSESVVDLLAGIVSKHSAAAPAALSEVWSDFVQQILHSDLLTDKTKPVLDADKSLEEEDYSSSDTTRGNDVEVYSLVRGTGKTRRVWQRIPWTDL